jgi:hypothetical protein
MRDPAPRRQGSFNFSDYQAYSQRLDQMWGYISLTDRAPIWLGGCGWEVQGGGGAGARGWSQGPGLTRCGLHRPRKCVRSTPHSPISSPGAQASSGRSTQRPASAIPGGSRRCGAPGGWVGRARGRAGACGAAAPAAISALHAAPCAWAAGLPALISPCPSNAVTPPCSDAQPHPSVSPPLPPRCRYIRERDLDWSYWPLDGTQGPSRQQGQEEAYGLLNATWDGFAYQPLIDQLWGLM